MLGVQGERSGVGCTGGEERCWVHRGEEWCWVYRGRSVLGVQGGGVVLGVQGRRSGVGCTGGRSGVGCTGGRSGVGCTGEEWWCWVYRGRSGGVGCTGGEERCWVYKGGGGLPQAAVHPLCSPSQVRSPPLSRSSSLCSCELHPALTATLPPVLGAGDQLVL